MSAVITQLREELFRNRVTFLALKISFGLMAVFLFWLEVQKLRYALGVDFPQDYAAAQIWWLGSSVYGPDVATTASNSCHFSHIDNFHPPTTVLFYLHSHLLSCHHAYLLSQSAYLLLATSVLFILGVSKFGTRSLLPFLFLNIFLGSGTVSNSIGLGQSSLGIMGLLFLAYLFLDKEREFSAGVCVGLASSMKLFPAIYCLYFLISRQWKAFFAASLTAIAFVGLFLVKGSSTDFLIYVQDIAQRNVIEWGAYPLEISLSSFLSPLFLHSTVSKAPFPNEHIGVAVHQGILAIGLLIFVLHTNYILQRGLRDLAFVTTGLYMILISPISWWHFAPFLIFSGLLIHSVISRREDWRITWLALLCVSICGLLPSHYDIVFALANTFDRNSALEKSFFLMLAKPGAILTVLQLGLVVSISKRRKEQERNTCESI